MAVEANLQSIPVDVSRLGAIRCVVEAEAKSDYETGEIKKNRDGAVIWTVGVSVRQADSRRTSVIEIAVPGEPVGLVEGAPVAVVGLVALPWERGGRSGVSYRADTITPASDAGPAPRTSAPVASAVRDVRGKSSGGDA